MNAEIASTKIVELNEFSPSENTIQCFEDLTYKSDENKRIIFRLLIKEEQNFNFVYASKELPVCFKGVIILISDTEKFMPKIYGIRNDDVICFAGRLRRQYHYVFKNNEVRQLCATTFDWGQDLAKEIAYYFEF